MQVDKKYMEVKYTTKSAKQTQKLGESFAKNVLALQRTSLAQGKNNSAVVFGLSGNLGGGKTTFLQGFSKGIGIKEKILSPTFVILKRFKIKGLKFEFLYHIDCYRLETEKDILELGWKEIISDPKNIIAVEWPEKIKKGLPKNAIFIKFKFIDNKTREIKFDRKF